jgi:hypothetical protein
MMMMIVMIIIMIIINSVGIKLGYGLDDRGCRVRFTARAGNFFTTASGKHMGPTRRRT